ncbi:MAG TPA: GMC family oxidoreductase [Solirubrobacteraceae bacterium]|nr:GMC family oxidoreductase [Solirubrobacteraceae bacterium]
MSGVTTRLGGLVKASARPEENDSAWLLDVHRRGIPGAASMARYADADEVDMVIIGAGAGGSTLAQRLARRGWRIVILESGPFWDPDRDWVSDEAGQHGIYWTQPRVIGGQDPVELGKNNSGHGVGGSMIHYAGYTPRFHPSDFRTRSQDGVGADWPIAYRDLRPHYERVEKELPVAGQDWPWGDPHRYPHAAHPISGAAEVAREGARRAGITMRVGPVGITNGVFGNRPHCIYRGFCLQACKVNAKASPFVTHLPDAIAHGVEVRADSHAVRIEVDKGGRCTAVTYRHQGAERHQRAAVVVVAGYSIETPRLLLNSTSARFPEGLANREDQVGRYVMVQGAPQVAGRFPQVMHQYKAPPPEICSEDFYETDSSRGFARGFSIQTVGPLPIGWAEHVLADGHWGHALREYMRDYAHWTTLGLLCELLPRAENRVTLAEETDSHGMPVAHFSYSQCDNDRANIAYGKRVIERIWEAAGAQDTLAVDRYAHLVGGCRMGDSPDSSVIDADHRAWGVPNLFICDGSVMPTQGSANPALTIMALASRLAARLASGRVPAGAGAGAGRG